MVLRVGIEKGMDKEMGTRDMRRRKEKGQTEFKLG
jgi:hypothetical protein